MEADTYQNLRIAIVGYGKMGKAVEQEALARGHQVSERLGRMDQDRLAQLDPEEIDAVIEFTHPKSFWTNMEGLLPTGIPVVTGTTGWYDRKDELDDLVQKSNGGLMYAANFSVGVNVMFKINKELARIMNRYPEYDPLLEEQHHRYKADAPSGTAVALAQDMIDSLERKNTIASDELRTRPPLPDELSVGYVRAGGIIGKHAISYTSDIDQITLSHEAFNRRGFALGAVIAAEYMVGKKGLREFGELF
ncbi:MAG: 4-hydroxy-tetrahydrodipicolinate reductase [Bacteroidia bacterium]